MRLPKSLIRMTVAGILLLGGALVAGAMAEAVLARRDARRFPPPGRLVDIGGRRLHLACSGMGTPTILAEMGAGGWSVYWVGIQREMARVTRFCLYDRAGFGWSDAGPRPHSPDSLLGDLHELLARSGEPGPFVLAGHSMGGWLIRLYQARYPASVVGMGLVESGHPKQWAELPSEIWEFTRAAAGTLRFMSVAGRFGVLRLLGNTFATQELPPDVMGAYRAAAIRPSALAGLASEIINSEALAAAVDTLEGLGNLPLVVVSAGASFDAFRDIAPEWPFDEANAVWADLQRDLTRLSSRAWQHVSPVATHNIHGDDPGLIVRALSELVDTVRAGPAAFGAAAGDVP